MMFESYSYCPKHMPIVYKCAHKCEFTIHFWTSACVVMSVRLCGVFRTTDLLNFNYSPVEFFMTSLCPTSRSLLTVP